MLLYAPAQALPDRSATREYFFLGDKSGCYDGEKTVHFSFDAIQGKTELDIPINYLLNAYNWDGIVHLWIELGLEPEALEPYCDKVLPLIKAGERPYGPSFPQPMRVYISNWGNGGLTMEEKISGMISGRPGIVEYAGDSAEYAIFKTPPGRRNYMEYLIPNTNAMGILYYLECNSVEDKGTCKMNFHYHERLNIEINFKREKLGDLKKMYKSTVSLLDKFFVTNGQE